MKYSDRGLADDRFWFNGGNVQRRLFRILFWISNVFFILIQLGNILAHLFYFEENVFLKVYRCMRTSRLIIMTMFLELKCARI